MAREPVAIDFISLGERGGRGGGLLDDERVAARLVKPVASVPPECRHVASSSEGNAAFSRLGAAGLCRPPWAKSHGMAMRQLQEPSCEGAEGRSRAFEFRASTPPMSASNRFEASAQQARKVYGDPQQQGLRSSVPMRTSEAPGGAASGPHASSSSAPSAGFGSPVPVHSQTKPGNAGAESGAVPQQQVNMAAAHALDRAPASGKPPQTAQLTIFYAGMVNVYDEVPLDQAQAIMVLAGKGMSMSSSNTDAPGVDCGRLLAKALPSPVSQPPSRAGSPAATASGGAAPLPRGPTISNWPTPTTTGVELPQARKASLARFLERRKDRVRQGPYRNNEAAAHEARARLNRENSPSPSSSSRPPRRSLSPPEASNLASNVGNGQAGASTSDPHSPRPGSLSQERPREAVSGASSPSKGMKAAKETQHSS